MEEQILFENRSRFREWLVENHRTSSGVWVVFSKSKELKSVKAEEALEEALCFGWIDGQMKSIDDTKYIKKFTPRRKGSKWSEKNRGLTEILIKQNLMTEAGLAAIEQAKAQGTWDIPKEAPISDEQIAILVEAINGVEPAASNFKKMPGSVQRIFTIHYLSAKAEATRQKRLEQIIERLNENKRLM